MNLVLFAHPTYLAHQSMPRYARMLADGLRARGHTVEVWMPEPLFYRLPAPGSLRKWLGYVDQYLRFPAQVRRRVRRCPPDTLFVFTDHALGPWVPLVAQRPHVVHCHDFLAQRSAIGEVPENPTGWTGRQYQTFIRRGYSQARHFISVSQTTRTDSQRFLPTAPPVSEVVYNGLNQSFASHDSDEARRTLGRTTGLALSSGYLLHVGGNQWYKNRSGVVELYDTWRATAPQPLPLLLIGEAADEALQKKCMQSAFRADIHLLSDLADEQVRLAYAGATVFLFPSLAEGFGWPITEAMASSCPVITTHEAPMTEVGAEAAFYIPRRPAAGAAAWAAAGAEVVQQVITLTPAERKAVVEKGLANARRFAPDAALDHMEEIYRAILATYPTAP